MHIQRQRLDYKTTSFETPPHLPPLLGAWLANQIGLSGALLVSGGIRLVGFLLFAFWRPERATK
jgi:hypothetical protein